MQGQSLPVWVLSTPVNRGPQRATVRGVGRRTNHVGGTVLGLQSLGWADIPRELGADAAAAGFACCTQATR